MTEKLEKKETAAEQLKITNLAELKSLLEKKFGVYSFFLNPVLKRLSGYEAPKSMFPDIEKEKEQEKLMLENTKVNQEIIESLNKAIAQRAKIMEAEVELAKQRNNEEYQKECQEILDLFKNKQLVLTEDGKVEIQEPSHQ